MSRSVLLTAAEEDIEQFRTQLQGEQPSLMYTPLERYQTLQEDEKITEAIEDLQSYENIVHGSKRNAQYFIEKVKEADRMEEARQCLNLAVDQYAADYLEEAGIPAIHPQAQGKAVNLLEFMLRVRRLGETLYPCGDKTNEDLPGLLRELDIPVHELILFTLEGPTQAELSRYKETVMANQPDIVIFHSRRSVNRILAAFPDLNYSEPIIITGDQAVSDKLEKQGINVHEQANGSWASILDAITEL